MCNNVCEEITISWLEHTSRFSELAPAICSCDGKKLPVKKKKGQKKFTERKKKKKMYAPVNNAKQQTTAPAFK